MATTAAPGRWTRLTAPGRVDGRMLLGVVLVAVSVIGGLLFWGSARETVPVLVAARDLPAGHVVERDDLSVTRLKADGTLAPLTISEAELDSVVGRTLGSAVHAGELVVKPDLAEGVLIGSKEVAITIPVEADAVYPGLRQGDSVAMLATPAEGEGLTVTILDHAVVYDVSLEPGRIAIGRDSGAEDRGLTNVTLVVPEAEAERVAQATVKWTVTLALLSAGTVPSAGTSVRQTGRELR
jgi:Flp pilus assembly protein CpaB